MDLLPRPSSPRNRFALEILLIPSLYNQSSFHNNGGYGRIVPIELNWSEAKIWLGAIQRYYANLSQAFQEDYILERLFRVIQGGIESGKSRDQIKRVITMI
jgi:hypothetical protein